MLRLAKNGIENSQEIGETNQFLNRAFAVVSREAKVYKACKGFVR